MKHYPLLFTFTDRISSPGHYEVEVVARGRVLMIEEDEGWWFAGVNPGGLAEGGATVDEAYAKYRGSYREVLADIAADCDSTADFCREARLFFDQSDPDTTAEWEAARQDAANGLITMDALRKVTPANEERRRIEVRVISEVEVSVPAAPCLAAAGEHERAEMSLPAPLALAA